MLDEETQLQGSLVIRMGFKLEWIIHLYATLTKWQLMIGTGFVTKLTFEQVPEGAEVLPVGSDRF